MDIYPVESAINIIKLNNSDTLCPLEQKKLGHLAGNEQEELKVLISKFSFVFTDVPRMTAYISHDVDVGDVHPIKQRVNPMKLKVIREEVKYSLDNKIIEPSSSQWSSPCVLVPKPDGSYRFYINFCRLNAVTKTDSFPLMIALIV